MTDSVLTVTYPTLCQYAYYLKKATGDSPEQQIARQQAFIAELQRAADALRESLGLPSEPITWRDEVSAGRHKMVLRYYSGSASWQSVDGQTLARLIAHELNDSYVLCIILCRLGQEYSPDIFTGLHQNLPWQPDPGQPEWLGQSFFYAGLSTALAPELARAVFGSAALWHTTLTCGEMYCRRSLETPYLLIFATPTQERLADDFFGQMALELGWYTRKAFSQRAQYETHLRPATNEMERSLLTSLDEARSLHRRLGAGEKDFETLTAFHEQIRALEIAIPEHDDLLTTVRNILTAIKINVQNYRWVTEANEFLMEPGQDEIFREQRRRLERLPDQVEADLEFWQPGLEQARRTLEILRPVAERFPPANRDLKRMVGSIREHVPTPQRELTIMFDDIKNSTAYIYEHGDRQWQNLLQQYDDLLYPIFSRHQCWVVRHLGDGSLSVFLGATAGVQAAVELQDEFKRHNSAAEPINRLHVRIGLHTGPAIVVGETDVLGLTVHFASRVCGQADAGEIVISEATHHQAGDDTADFEDMGERKLKGIPEPVRLYRSPPQK